MRIVTYNVNGIRALHSKGALAKLIETTDPDVLCMQETKSSAEVVQELAKDYPYTPITNPNTWKNGYAGVSTWIKNDLFERTTSLIPFIMPEYGEGRVIQTAIQTERSLQPIYLVNVYTLNSGGKDELRKEWDKEFYRFIGRESDHPIMIVGDLNVVMREVDHWRGLSNVVDQGPGLMRYEREGIECLMNDHYVFDPYTGTKKSWHSYRDINHNHGWRLDYTLISCDLLQLNPTVDILEDFAGSDHRPVVLDIKL